MVELKREISPKWVGISDVAGRRFAYSSLDICPSVAGPILVHISGLASAVGTSTNYSSTNSRSVSMRLPKVKRRDLGNLLGCGSNQASRERQSSIAFGVVDRSLGIALLMGSLADQRQRA